MGTRFLSFFLCLILAIPPGWATDRTQTREADTTAAVSATEAPAAQDILDNSAGRDNSKGAAETLTDEEAEQLEARAEDPGPEVAGGALSNLHLTYAVIALAAIALVLILK